MHNQYPSDLPSGLEDLRDASDIESEMWADVARLQQAVIDNDPDIVLQAFRQYRGDNTAQLPSWYS